MIIFQVHLHQWPEVQGNPQATLRRLSASDTSCQGNGNENDTSSDDKYA